MLDFAILHKKELKITTQSQIDFCVCVTTPYFTVFFDTILAFWVPYKLLNNLKRQKKTKPVIQ